MQTNILSALMFCDSTPSVCGGSGEANGGANEGFSKNIGDCHWTFQLCLGLQCSSGVYSIDRME